MFSNQNDVLNELKEQKESHLKMAMEMGRVGSALVNIEKMMSKSLNTYTSENIVLQTYTQTFRSEGFLYNSLYIGDSAQADNAKLVIDGIVPSFTIPLVAGENAVNIPDGATFMVTTTSNKPVTALLTRYNTPGNTDSNVTLQGSLPAGAAVIGNVGINGAIPTGANVIGNVGINGAIPTGTNVIGLVKLQDGSGNNFLVASNYTTDANAIAGASPDAQWLYNGATWDRMRGNLPTINALASAARTATGKSTVQTNYNGRGIRVKLTVTVASGTGGLTVQLLDEASILNTQVTTPVTATGTYTYYFYPGIANGGTQAINAVLSRSFYLQVSAGDATSYTYQLDYELIN